MAETLLESLETSRRENKEADDIVRLKDLSFSPDNVERTALESFLRRYAPMQLLADRTRSTRVRLSRRTLSHSALLHTASTWTSQMKASGGDTETIARLAESIAVDKRTLLPHPLWTTKHDAVLVHAISKHGWIEQDSCCRAITNDPEIKWGAPFEASTVEGSLDVSQKKNFDDLPATAKQASDILNTHHELLEAATGFNKDLVVRAYGLVRSPEGATDEDSAKQPTWIVDTSALEQEVSSGSSEEQKIVELPTKKDLVKRAKIVLTRGVVRGSGSRVNTELSASETHGFSVLDQSERCNILLAELMRGVVKMPSQEKSIKVLCSLVTVEAKRRAAAVEGSELGGEATKRPESKVTAEMKEILSQCSLVESIMKKTARQAKNLVRVMLGEKPSTLR